MPHFEVSWEIIPLKLKEIFTISRGSKSEVPNVFLKITKDGFSGYGEAGPNTRYQETTENVAQFFQKLPSDFYDDIEAPGEISKKIEKLRLPKIYSAMVAVEMAWLDWDAKRSGLPLWRHWKYENPRTPQTSYTIGIDTKEVMQEKVKRASDYPIYKIKLGTDRDREIIRAIREVTDKPLRVDANEGWTDLDQAKEEIVFLAANNIELVEQPMPASDLYNISKLKEWSPIPLVADESFTGHESIEEIARAFDVINIKLMKIGSLVKAREVLKKAHECGLKVMIGCMIESALANAAGALIALEADYADLDGHLLISNDPFSGLTVDTNGHINLSAANGFGVSLQNNLI